MYGFGSRGRRTTATRGCGSMCTLALRPPFALPAVRLLLLPLVPLLAGSTRGVHRGGRQKPRAALRKNLRNGPPPGVWGWLNAPAGCGAAPQPRLSAHTPHALIARQVFWPGQGCGPDASSVSGRSGPARLALGLDAAWNNWGWWAWGEKSAPPGGGSVSTRSLWRLGGWPARTIWVVLKHHPGVSDRSTGLIERRFWPNGAVFG